MGATIFGGNFMVSSGGQVPTRGNHPESNYPGGNFSQGKIKLIETREKCTLHVTYGQIIFVCLMSNNKLKLTNIELSKHV